MTNPRLAARRFRELRPDTDLYEKWHPQDIEMFAKSTRKEPFTSAADEIRKARKRKKRIECWWGRDSLRSVIKVIAV